MIKKEEEGNITVNMAKHLAMRVKGEMERKGYDLRSLSTAIMNKHGKKLSGFSYGSINNYLLVSNHVNQKLLNKYYQRLSFIYSFLMDEDHEKEKTSIILDNFQASLLNNRIISIVPKLYGNNTFHFHFKCFQINNSLDEIKFLYLNEKYPSDWNFYHHKLGKIELHHNIFTLLIMVFDYNPYASIYSRILTKVIYADKDLKIRSSSGIILPRFHLNDDLLESTLANIGVLLFKENHKYLEKSYMNKKRFYENLRMGFELYKDLHEKPFEGFNS
jgi:hypothetical protein